jgi:hypothetical protein
MTRMTHEIGRWRGIRHGLALLVTLAVPGRALADEPAPPAAPTPPVSIDSTRPFTVIEHRANEVRGWNVTIPPTYVHTEQWEPVCVAPCSVPLDPNGVYRVGGGGVAPSGPFVLPHAAPLRLHVRAGSGFWHDAGVGTFVAGLVTVIAGGAVWGSAPSQTNEHQTAIAGAAIAGAGLAVLALGAVVWLTSGSVVTTDDGRSL